MANLLCLGAIAKKRLGGSSRMGFVRVASAKDLKAGEMMTAEAGGKEICVANVGGKFYAIGNRCTHMGCLLSDGTLSGETVTCPCHGSTFNVLTGAVVKGPAGKSEPVYEAKVEKDQVLVDV
jgi:nitrite reductase/ring-hydroxylating ferredoxin subunit